MRVLLEGEDGYRLTDPEDRELYEAVENLYVLDRAQRVCSPWRTCCRAPSARACTVGRGRPLRERCSTTRRHADVQRFQVFDFEAMRAYPALLEPLLFYVLAPRRASAIPIRAEAATLKVCVMDEAWRFIQHPTLRAYVQEALKTWRKRNAPMLLATQSVDDFASADLLRTVVESCPTKLLLANPALDRRQYARPVPAERDGAGPARGACAAAAAAPEAADARESAHPARRSAVLLALHEHPVDNERVRRRVPRHGFEAGSIDSSASA